jgi:hypothetical protein
MNIMTQIVASAAYSVLERVDWRWMDNGFDAGEFSGSYRSPGEEEAEDVLNFLTDEDPDFLNWLHDDTDPEWLAR